MTVRWDEDILKDRRTIVIYNISKLVRSEVGGEGRDWWKRGKSRGEDEKYKNKCESSKAVTTEGTTNCYMEADARTRSRGCFVSFPFFSSDQLISWSINHEERILYVTNETK